jgi:hypothetical protein
MTFIIAILLLAADFYYLKNIAGRRLVGLRWWNEVDPSTGDSHWVFESSEPGTKVVNPTDSRFFWIAIYAQPLLWIALALAALLTLNFIWLPLVGGFPFLCLWRRRAWQGNTRLTWGAVSIQLSPSSSPLPTRSPSRGATSSARPRTWQAALSAAATSRGILRAAWLGGSFRGEENSACTLGAGQIANGRLKHRCPRLQMPACQDFSWAEIFALYLADV